MTDSRALNRPGTETKTYLAGIVLKVLTILLKIAVYAFFAIFILLTVYPLFWALISSFKSTIEIIKNPLALPTEWTLINFKESIEIYQIGEYTWNSLIFTIPATVFTITFAFTASYAFAKINLKITKLFETLFLIGIFIPHQAFIMPLFLMVNYLGIYDSRVSIIVIYCAINLPLAIYLITGQIKKIPDTLIESARLDGAGTFKIIMTIVLPMAKPIVISAAVITALFCWNEFLIPFVLTQSDATRPLTIGVYKSNGCFCNEYGMRMPTLIYGSFPQILIFLIFRKSIFKGIRDGFS